MEHRPLRFIRRGKRIALGNVPPDRTLLEVLREDLGLTGTKEGCGEGDCGACTVVLGEPDVDHGGNAIKYRAINSCIRLAHSIDGMALWTVEDLAEDDGTLHPAQEAMVQCHGSQCGFCTPGFVMSLFGMYQNYIAPTLGTGVSSPPPGGAGAPWGGPAARRVCKGEAITRTVAQEDLSGNLCRCTGYRPILDAAQRMATLPPVRVDEADLLQKLKLLAQEVRALEANLAYIAPDSVAALLAARAAHPDAQVVAGGTDVGLWVTKQHRQFARVLDVTRAAELRRIETSATTIAIGAAVPLADAYAALEADRPVLHRFAMRFAGLPVRNSGTLGGNVANGSPIGDSMPLLIALGAQVVLASAAHGERTLALEDFYLGYRKTALAADELLVRILVPRHSPGEALKAYKISKRQDDDISAVCLAINLHIDNGVVRAARIGAGGVAATPARARQTEAALAGQPWSEATAQQAAQALQAEFRPISDMRASGAYRRALLAALLRRFWLETQGVPDASLETLTATETA
ncbi:xanthine dehydrogenase small subunit [Ramlibacter sp. H39-3-26]|uniref:xanthine dehydrogenase small subunit n=1 Tax=Curvibacter soli TaxID=3031331 RepID=UPI0023D9CC72|nr:xanthine dehydrogenase small subunit [Ramlibacter sp. H39-3-26]MDF1486636.1 xanthine dehydrogenase small subunit [Ramlibacter sp. H39-3-26]